MSKTSEAEIVKREVGERVDVMCSFDPTTVKELAAGVFEAVVTTAEVDRQSEVIDTSGLDVSTWEKTGMPVLYGHDYSSLPIGKGLSYTVMKSKMKAKFQLAVEEYPFAATVAALIKGGYLNAVSIGGLVKQWSQDYMTIEKMEMVEFSVVPVPANASAIITSRALETMTGKSLEHIKEEFEDFSRKVLLDKISGMDKDEVKESIKVLRNLLDRLEESATADTAKDTTDVKRIKHIVLRDAKAVVTQSQRVSRTIKLSL